MVLSSQDSVTQQKAPGTGFSDWLISAHAGDRRLSGFVQNLSKKISKGAWGYAILATLNCMALYRGVLEWNLPFA